MRSDQSRENNYFIIISFHLFSTIFSQRIISSEEKMFGSVRCSSSNCSLSSLASPFSIPSFLRQNPFVLQQFLIDSRLAFSLFSSFQWHLDMSTLSALIFVTERQNGRMLTQPIMLITFLKKSKIKNPAEKL